VILWCTSPDDIWATDVKTEGWAGSPSTKLLHWDGQSWHTMTESYDNYFLSGWGSQSQGVWIVGHTGHVSWAHSLIALHWDGTQLKRLVTWDLNQPIQQAPMAWQAEVFGTNDGVWISGDGEWKVATPVPKSCLNDYPG
jgi:hypothetical protein